MPAVKPTPPLNIFIEGNIGSGKSTLLNHLNLNPLFQCFPEPLSDWQNCDGLNIFRAFNQRPVRYTFQFQMLVLLTLFQRQQHANRSPNRAPVRIFERSFYSAKNVFSVASYQQAVLDEINLRVLHKYFDFFINECTCKPDLIIYLRTSPRTALNKISDRSRSEELGIPLDYIELLHDTHEQWLNRENVIPVVTINGDFPLIDMHDEYEKASKAIADLLSRDTTSEHADDD